MNHQASRDLPPMLDEVDPNSQSNPAVALTADPSTSAKITLDIPAEVQYVNILGACACAFLANLEQLADPEITLYNLELAIQEVSVNIATHAYANSRGRIHMSAVLSHQPLKVTIILQDTGASFNPSLVPQPALGELQEHGYGLFLVTQLMDEVEYKQIDGGSVWKLSKNLPVIVNS